MRFLLDANLPPMLARRISGAGHEALHVTDMVPAYASDLEIAREANRLNAILMSKDEDFVDLSVRGVLRTPLVWIRSGNMTTIRLWTLLGPLLPGIVASLEAGDRIVEVK